MAHLVVDCTHPHCVFARVDTQLLQAINDTRVQILIAHCTPPPLPPPLPHQLAPVSQQHPATAAQIQLGTSAIWDSMDIHTPINNYQHSPRPTSQSAPSSPSSPSGFSTFFIFQFSPHTRFEPPISVAHSEIPRQVQDTVEETPLAAGPPPQTPTRLLLAAHPPRPRYRILGRMIF
ncbi:hypothetical protein BASA83_011045 [Batrachochytrium salamandrivorans]|nr:hypothetical protein BASA83_011045 [Batrachochytrium salamandrivorans]